LQKKHLTNTNNENKKFNTIIEKRKIHPNRFAIIEQPTTEIHNQIDHYCKKQPHRKFSRTHRSEKEPWKNYDEKKESGKSRTIFFRGIM
jgi:hypothetical protein